MEITAFYKKWIEPFAALGILIMLGSLVFLLLQEQQLKEEISENCGWGDEMYSCYCEKSKVWEIEMLLNGTLEMPNVSLVR